MEVGGRARGRHLPSLLAMFGIDEGRTDVSCVSVSVGWLGSVLRREGCRSMDAVWTLCRREARPVRLPSPKMPCVSRDIDFWLRSRHGPSERELRSEGRDERGLSREGGEGSRGV